MKVAGRADRALVSWLDEVLSLLRVVPKGWRAELRLERDPDPVPPDRVEDS